jgi:hypothetical protein
MRQKFNAGLRIFISSFFLFAAFGKLGTAAEATAAPTIYSEWAKTPTIRYIMLAFEVGLALSLSSGCFPRASAVTVGLALLGFSWLVALELRRDRPKPCGCIGADLVTTDPNNAPASLKLHLAANGLMIGAVTYLVLFDDANRKTRGARLSDATLCER